jgi:hypothetical protein
MRRGIALVAIVLAGAVAIACGGGDEGEDGVRCGLDDYDQRTPFGSRELPRVTLEEAQERAQFDLVLPDELPEGVTVQSVLLSPDRLCPEERIDRAELFFSGDGYSFAIMQSESKLSLGGATEPIEINGVEGQLLTHNVSGAPRIKSVAWRSGSLSFMAYPVLGGRLTEEAFLEILESIPE